MSPVDPNLRKVRSGGSPPTDHCEGILGRSMTVSSASEPVSVRVRSLRVRPRRLVPGAAEHPAHLPNVMNILPWRVRAFIRTTPRSPII